MKPGFWTYVRAAFNARPLGMPIPPNWIFLAFAALLGATVDRGFLLLGAGFELAYLGWLSSNPRFRRTVAARGASDGTREWQATLDRLAAQLPDADRARHRALETRCRAIVDELTRASSFDSLPGGGADDARASLARLAWMYLRLLVTRQAIQGVLGDGEPDRPGDRGLEKQLLDLRARLDREELAPDLRTSLAGQAEILAQRIERRAEARDRLSFLEAELTRIEQQVELVREQAVGAPDAGAVSRRIDDIAASLDGTATWIREQQKVYGAVSDLLREPPPARARAAARDTEA